VQIDHNRFKRCTTLLNLQLFFSKLNDIQMQSHILKIKQDLPKLVKCKNKKCRKKLFIKSSLDGHYCADCSFERYFDESQKRIDHWF